MGRAPVLLCLNLERGRLDPADDAFVRTGARAAPNIARCIDSARLRGMRIIYVFSCDTRERPRAIAGLEPLGSELVLFKTGPSILRAPEFVEADAEQPLGDIILVGFALAFDILAAVIDAQALGRRIGVIADAVASPDVGGHAGETIDAVMLSVIARMAPCVTTDGLVARFRQQIETRCAVG